MADQYSGEMLVGLTRLVDRIVSSPNLRFVHSGPEDAELEHLRILLGSGQETPLKSAMMKLIDRLKSDNPDPVEVTAAMEEVKRLWPEVAPNGAGGRRLPSSLAG